MFARTAALRTATAVLARAPATCAPAAVAARAFSVSAFRTSAAATDSELVDVLAKELQFEKENMQPAMPSFLSEFLARKTFTVQDRPGDNEVVMAREFGNEKITVTFSIDDVANAQPIEDADGQPTRDGDEVAYDFPVATVITITKKTGADAGAITFQTIVEGGQLQITNVTFTDDPVLAVADTAEADYKRRGQYVGPVFDELDDNLAAAFHTYLEARGVTAELAEFIPEYVEFKEQNEYVRWLDRVKSFVSRA
ncbi:Mitochondrial acidic protein mam33 [Allomyces arbusculus]|nr:Mitochondrial acidic protein mam33 [Allomyces arbusculus]